MNVTVAVYNLNTLKQCTGLIDTAVLMCPKYAYVYENDFSIDEAISFCREHGIDVILSVDRIFTEHELPEIKDFIIRYEGYRFLVSDLGVVELCKELGLIQNVIYDPDTLVCNSSDLSVYASYGFAAVGMSNEITIADVKVAYEKTGAPLFYQVFGRKLMFYSKRKLLSLYEGYRGLNSDKKNLSLVEEKRLYHIPVYENENGIYCYRHYFISLLKEMQNLGFLKYAYFETVTLTDGEVYEVLSSYKDDDEKRLAALRLDTEDGFAYNDTVYVKEKIIQ